MLKKIAQALFEKGYQGYVNMRTGLLDMQYSVLTDKGPTLNSGALCKQLPGEGGDSTRITIQGALGEKAYKIQIRETVKAFPNFRTREYKYKESDYEEYLQVFKLVNVQIDESFPIGNCEAFIEWLVSTRNSATHYVREGGSLDESFPSGNSLAFIEWLVSTRDSATYHVREGRPNKRLLELSQIGGEKFIPEDVFLEYYLTPSFEREKDRLGIIVPKMKLWERDGRTWVNDMFGWEFSLEPFCKATKIIMKDDEGNVLELVIGSKANIEKVIDLFFIQEKKDINSFSQFKATNDELVPVPVPVKKEEVVDTDKADKDELNDIIQEIKEEFEGLTIPPFVVVSMNGFQGCETLEEAGKLVILAIKDAGRQYDQSYWHVVKSDMSLVPHEEFNKLLGGVNWEEEEDEDA